LTRLASRSTAIKGESDDDDIPCFTFGAGADVGDVDVCGQDVERARRA